MSEPVSLLSSWQTKFLSGHGNAMGGVVIDSGRFDWGADGTGKRFSSLCLPEPACEWYTTVSSSYSPVIRSTAWLPAWLH